MSVWVSVGRGDARRFKRSRFARFLFLCYFPSGQFELPHLYVSPISFSPAELTVPFPQVVRDLTERKLTELLIGSYYLLQNCERKMCLNVSNKENTFPLALNTKNKFLRSSSGKD